MTAAVILADSLEASEAAASRVSTCVSLTSLDLSLHMVPCNSFRYLLCVPGRDHSQELGVHGREPGSFCCGKRDFMNTPEVGRSVPLQRRSVSHHRSVLLAPSGVGQRGLVVPLLQWAAVH